MNKSDVKNHLLKAYSDNNLLTAKHDPNNLGTHLLPFRTVVSYEVAADLFNFIDTGIYKVFEYQNTRYPNSPIYLEIIPEPAFSVPSSGVTSYSPLATSALDRIIAVSGASQGWHIFGEHSNNISQMFTNGDLTNKQELL